MIRNQIMTLTSAALLAGAVCVFAQNKNLPPTRADLGTIAAPGQLASSTLPSHPADRAQYLIDRGLPPTNWDMFEEPPGVVATMLKAAGTPIDRNSFENVEQLRDTAARWRTMRMLAGSKAMALA